MSTQKLTLTLYSAEGLHETGKIKKQDPYTIVEVGERVFKTKADSSAGSDPVWNEELQCDVPTGVTTASFTIHDKNLFVKDDIIGVAKYDFSNATGDEETIPVFTKEGSPAGHLKLRAVFSGGRGAQTTGRATTGAATGAPIGAAAGAPIGAATGHTGTGAGARSAQATAPAAGTAIPPPIGGATGHTGVGTGTHGTSHKTRDASDVESTKTRSTTVGTAGAHGTAAPGQHGTAALGTGVAIGPTESRTAGTEAGAYGAGGAGVAGREGHTKGAAGFTGPMSNLEGQQGVVCDQKFYMVEEDRPIVKEIKQYVREHHPVQREMIVETKPTGRERELATGPAELVGVQEKVIETTTPKPCP